MVEKEENIEMLRMKLKIKDLELTIEKLKGIVDKKLSIFTNFVQNQIRLQNRYHLEEKNIFEQCSMELSFFQDNHINEDRVNFSKSCHKRSRWRKRKRSNSPPSPSPAPKNNDKVTNENRPTTSSADNDNEERFEVESIEIEKKVDLTNFDMDKARTEYNLEDDGEDTDFEIITPTPNNPHTSGSGNGNGIKVKIQKRIVDDSDYDDPESESENEVKVRPKNTSLVSNARHRPKDEIWVEYFTKIEDGKVKAYCRHCKSIISAKAGRLKNHINKCGNYLSKMNKFNDF